MKIDKAKLFENFKNIKNFANFHFLICYKNLFNTKGIITNIGCILLMIIILFHIITIIIFCLNQFSSIYMKIRDITFGIFKYNLIEKKHKRKIKNLKSRVKKNGLFSGDSKKNMISDKIFNKKKLIKKKKHDKWKNKSLVTVNANNNIIIDGKVKHILKYIDEEINLLPYNLAKEYDKRTFCPYYISLLKTKHSLLKTLFNNNDYNSRIIKFDLFLIGFAIDYIVNAFFYNDDTMHNIYESKGQFDLEAQIPIMVYSSLITMVLNAPLEFLAFSNDSIIDFKQNKSTINLNKRKKNLKNILKIKFILYFLISFILLTFFWYYISIFCVIYRNTQIHLLKDTLMSFGLSLLFPFVIYLLPGLFRIPSLSNDKNNKECLYNFSKFLQTF